MLSSSYSTAFDSGKSLTSIDEVNVGGLVLRKVVIDLNREFSEIPGINEFLEATNFLRSNKNQIFKNQISRDKNQIKNRFAGEDLPHEWNSNQFVLS